jgi:hypothetical protein
VPAQPHGPQIVLHRLLPGAEIGTGEDWDIVDTVVGRNCCFEKISERNLCQLTVCNGDESLSRSKLLSVRQVSMLCVVHSIIIPNVLLLVRL